MFWDISESGFRYYLTNRGEYQNVRTRTLSRWGHFRLSPETPKISVVIGTSEHGSDAVQSLIFSQDDGWTLDKAKSWVLEHIDIETKD
jgi:hypothetical protein